MAEMNDFNAGIIEEFRTNHGKVGGNFDGAPMVLITTTGAKSGQKRTNPLVSQPVGDVIYIFASKGGAPSNPDWYYNLLAHPEVEVEFGDDTFSAVPVINNNAIAPTNEMGATNTITNGSKNDWNWITMIAITLTAANANTTSIARNASC